MEKYQITERVDFFNQKELFAILRNLNPGEKIEVIKLSKKKEVKDGLA